MIKPAKIHKNLCYPNFLILCILGILVSTGCGTSPSEPPPTDETGEISFSIEWHQGQNEGDTYSIQAIESCSDLGLAYVQCYVYQEDDILLVQSPRWECEENSGTILEVSSGEDRQIVCTGLDSTEKIIYLGRLPKVTIAPDITTEAGTIKAFPFIASLFIPENNDPTVRANRDKLYWRTVSNADQYAVQVSRNENFQPLFIDSSTTETEYLPLVLEPNTTYYWRIVPMALNRFVGMHSAPRQFTTVPGSLCRPPVLDEIEDRTVVAGNPVNISVSATDPDEGQVLTFNASPLLDNMEFNPVTGNFTWRTTAADANLTQAITFGVCDNCPDYLPDDPMCGTPQEVVIYVQPTNGQAVCERPELAVIGNRSAVVGEELQITVNASLTYTPVTAIVYRATNLPDGANFDTASRRFTWTPTANQIGSQTVHFEACNRCATGESCDEENVNIAVERPNAPVVLQPPAITYPNDGYIGDNGCIPGLSFENSDLWEDPIILTLRWQAVDDADRYQVRLEGNGIEINGTSSTRQFQYVCDNVHNQNVAFPDCDITAPNAQYTWSVRAVADNGGTPSYSDWSTRQFIVEAINTDCNGTQFDVTGDDWPIGREVNAGEQVTIHFNYRTPYYSGVYLEFYGSGCTGPVTFYPPAYNSSSASYTLTCSDTRDLDHLDVSIYAEDEQRFITSSALH